MDFCLFVLNLFVDCLEDINIQIKLFLSDVKKVN